MLDPITELVETYVVKEQKELALLRYEKGLGESADEKGGFLTSWLPRPFCGELMLNVLFRLAQYLLLTKILLYVVFEYCFYVGVETESVVSS